MSGQAFLPARAQTGDQTGDRGLEQQDLSPLRFPRVQSGRAPTPVRDPPPRGPQLGRRGCPGRNQSPESARPPGGPAAGVTHFPVDSFRDRPPSSALSVLGLHKRVFGDAARAAAPECEGEPARFLFPFCPFSSLLGLLGRTDRSRLGGVFCV